MFASRITKEVRIGEDTVTIRALSGRAKERAQQATMTRAAGMLAQVGGAAVMAEITKLGGEDAVRSAPSERDPASAFDQQTVLREGIISWPADEPVTDETVGDLETEAADLLCREILILSRIALTDADKKTATRKRKNA